MFEDEDAKDDDADADAKDEWDAFWDGLFEDDASNDDADADVDAGSAD